MRRAHILILALYAWTTLAVALASLLSADAQARVLPAPDAEQGGLVTLRGNTRPEAKAINDRGRVADDLTIHHMMLQLQRTPEQEQALQQFIKEIHDPTSPLFHHWITAAEFGQRYGAAPAEVARVTDWLDSQGFKINLVYPNQMVIDFTGTAGQIRQAFRTEIHNLLVNGQAHVANMRDPQIPVALVRTVAGVVSLNDFRPHPMLKRRAKYTDGSADHPIVPADLATIYNFNPAFAAGYSGQGQTIVLIEDTDLYATADWDTFRSVLGLASAYPLGSLTQVHPPSSSPNNCTAPGVNGDDDEAAIDVEWASAAAPSATIELASCADTDTNFGGFIALQNLLNANGTPPAIVSISYGESESFLGASSNAYISSLYLQAVTAGVSVFVSSGDEGAASSDADQAYAQNGITVSGFTSTPYNVSVGGTDFADTYEKMGSTYWNSTNSTSYGSALSYLPEIPWNDSCASVLIGDYLGTLPTFGSGGLCDKGYFTTTASGSGGPSGCATGAPDIGGMVSGTCAGYAKPSWQSGFVGNPSDGVRDIPDVSLFAANGLWGHYYVFCLSDPASGLNCTGAPDTWGGAGGTSFAAPIMAGIQSLINQASSSQWGNPNPAYYSLAATEYGSGGNASCNSALGNAVAANCIFYDVTPLPLLYTGSGTGGDIDVPCLGGNCYLPSGSYGVLSTAPQTLSSAMVTSLGSGYTSDPSCTLSGGGGSGATCSASVTGVVSSLGLTNGGSGYTAGPTCTLTGGGGGSGAGCEAYFCTNNEVCYVVLTSFGSGYTSNPTCTISGGGGTGATCTAIEAPGIATNLTAAGSGYTTMPHCTLSGGGGTGGACAAMAVNTSDAYQPAFGAATGWDFATGIGTVNASNLVASFVPTNVSLSSPSVTFPPQALDTASTAQSVTVTNNGPGNLAILTVAISGTNSSDFAKSNDPCTGATIIPNGTCSVSVTFTPSAGGNRSALLNFTDIAPSSPQTVTLSGTETTPSVSLSANSVSFGNQPLGTSSVASPVTVTNTGTASLTFTSIVATGDFAVAAIGTTCSTTAPVPASGGSCAINLTFTPTATGSRSASLTLTDNASDSPQIVGLSGTGTAPTASLSTNSVTFGNQPVGTTSAASAVTVTNSGTASLTFTSIAATGDFVVAVSGTTCSASAPVAASGGSCVINLTFTPTATGSRSGNLTLTDNASGSPQTASLSGTGTGPVVSLSPPLTFSALFVGNTSSSQTVTLTNTGNSSLTFSAIAITGPFAIATSGTTCSASNPVAAAATCTVAIAFTPAAGGTSSGLLGFGDNAPNSPQTVDLSGTVQDFAVGPPSGSSTSATVAPGSPATYTLGVSGEGGFSGAVTFTCTGAPSGATCSVWPNTVTAGNSATNVTVTVTTTAPSVSTPRSRPLPPVPPLSLGLTGLVMLTLVLAMMAWADVHRNQSVRRQWRSTMVLLASAFLLALALAGCGGGGGGGGVALAPSNPVTPPGIYTLTVTGTVGSGSPALSHSVTLTLTVS